MSAPGSIATLDEIQNVDLRNVIVSRLEGDSIMERIAREGWTLVKTDSHGETVQFLFYRFAGKA